MAEIVNLFEIDIDISRAQKDTVALTEAIQRLKEQVKKAKDTQGEASEEYVKYSTELKVAQAELRENNKLTQNAIQANMAQGGSIEQLRKQLSVVSVQWAKLSKDERENSDFGKKLTAQKLALTNALKKEEKATGDTRRNVGNYTEAIQQALGTTSLFMPAVGKAGQSVIGLGTAFKVALGPIGLIIAAIGVVTGALKAFFTSNEEGQNRFARLWAAAEVVIGNIVDVIAELGEALLEPKQLFQDIGDFVNNTFGNIILGTFQSVVESAKAMFNGINLGYQKFKNLFTDNAEAVAEAEADLEKNFEGMANGVTRAAEGVKNLGEAFTDAKNALSEFIDEQEREIAIAQKLADRQANLDKFSRAALKANARDRLAIAKLRNQEAQRETFTARERLGFLEQAIALEEKILQRNLLIAQSKASIKREQNALSGSTKEDLDEQARLEADVFRVQEENFNKTKELQGQKAALAKEIRDLEAKGAQEALVEFEAILEEELALQAQAVEDAKAIDAQARESQKQQRAQAIEQERVNYENRLALAQENAFAILELEREQLEAKRQQEIDFAEKIGADTTLIEQKYAKAREAINEAETEAKLSLSSQFLGNIAQIAGEGTGIAKAASVAQATIDTYAGATAAYKALAGIPVVGPALGVAAAAAAVAGGLANVKQILSVKSGLPGDGATGGSRPSGTGAQAPPGLTTLAPDVNAGIVSRDLIETQNRQDSPGTVLVVDEVTAKQNVESINSQTATI